MNLLYIRGLNQVFIYSLELYSFHLSSCFEMLCAFVACMDRNGSLRCIAIFLNVLMHHFRDVLFKQNMPINISCITRLLV